MAEEKMQERKEGQVKTSLIIFKLALGLVLLALGALAVYCWWQDLGTVVRGSAGLVLFLAGAMTLSVARR